MELRDHLAHRRTHTDHPPDLVTRIVLFLPNTEPQLILANQIVTKVTLRILQCLQLPFILLQMFLIQFIYMIAIVNIL
jgi:hypothetical protein